MILHSYIGFIIEFRCLDNEGSQLYCSDWSDMKEFLIYQRISGSFNSFTFDPQINIYQKWNLRIFPQLANFLET